MMTMATITIRMMTTTAMVISMTMTMPMNIMIMMKMMLKMVLMMTSTCIYWRYRLRWWIQRLLRCYNDTDDNKEVRRRRRQRGWFFPDVCLKASNTFATFYLYSYIAYLFSRSWRCEQTKDDHDYCAEDGVDDGEMEKVHLSNDR